MRTTRFLVLLVSAFVAGVLILVYIKYTADQNVARLIKGNQDLLRQFRTRDDLKNLENHVLAVENRVGGAIAVNDSSGIQHLEEELSTVETDLQKLSDINSDDTTALLVQQLDNQIANKIAFQRRLIRAYSRGGKREAEQLIRGRGNKAVTDSILKLTNSLSQVRERALYRITNSVDASVKRVQNISFIIFLFFFICITGLFWYIINTVRKQNRLIAQVRRSEKKAQQAAGVKDRFLANMSHEIRTPLNAILGFTGLLQRHELDPESASYVHTIHQSGEHLLTLVNEILDLNKIEAGMLRIEQAPFSIRLVLQNLSRLLQPAAEQKGLQWRMLIDQDLPDMVLGDGARLQQILVNLAGNAIKFTSMGGVTIEAKRLETTAHEVIIGFVVRDTGIGISPENLDKIFNRFEQVHDVSGEDFGGTGLGLSIVKELVELQKGNIRAESRADEGSSIFVDLPYVVSPMQTTTPAPAEQREADPHDWSRLQVLVADDNEINRRLVEELLKKWKICPILAANGSEALEYLKKQSVDLILMDVQMPVLDGYQATISIRNDLRLQTPVIAMTALSMPGDKERCLEAGMNDYLPKPLRAADLQAMIGKWTAPAFQYINLSYMHEVAAGNLDYEAVVTRQFIEAVPQALQDMHTAYRQQDRPWLKSIAHNLRTTLSVMGLNETLDPTLEKIEQGNELEVSIQHVQRICESALTEARRFLATLRR